MLPAFIEDCVD